MARSSSTAGLVRRSLRRGLAVGATLGISVLGLTILSAPAANAAPCAPASSAVGSYVVPAGVFNLDIVAQGGRGQDGRDFYSAGFGGGTGGYGSTVTSRNEQVTPGETIYWGTLTGGANAFWSTPPTNSVGGVGVWVARTACITEDPESVIIVAAGGGGGGDGDLEGRGGDGGNADADGGAGGRPTSVNGRYAGAGGRAGTLQGPGAGGPSGWTDTVTYSSPGLPGSDGTWLHGPFDTEHLHVGGDGDMLGSDYTAGGGGGGGGYSGGGGGGSTGFDFWGYGYGGGGGGGGASFPRSLATLNYSGEVGAFFTPHYTPGVVLQSSVNPQVQGSPVTFTATVTAQNPGAQLGGGFIRFFDTTSGTASDAVHLGDVPVTLDPTGLVGTASVTTTDLAAGARTITASYTGSADSYSAYGRLTQTVLKTQTVAFTAPPTSGTAYGSTDQLTATSTSGLPVTIQVAPGSQGVCSLADGGVLSYLQGGTCVVEASQAGDQAYAAAPQVSQSIPVTGAMTQTISFTTTPPVMNGGDTYTPRAVGGGSGNPVLITSPDSVTCPIVNGVVTARLGGTCAIHATQAAGNGYSAAPEVLQQIQINPVPGYSRFLSGAPQAPQIGDKYTVVGEALYPSFGSANAVLTVDPASSACTMSTPFGTMVGVHVVQQAEVTYTGFGPCIIDVNVKDNPELPAYKVQDIAQAQQISYVRRTQDITFTSTDPPAPTYGGSTAVSATSSSGLAVRFSTATPATCTVSGADVAFVASGSCVVRAEQDGNDTWGMAPTATKELTIAPAPLTVTAPTGSSVYGSTPSTFAPTYDGFVGDDDPASLTAQPHCELPSAYPDAGSQPVICSGGSDQDYTFVYVAGVETVTKAPQSVEFTSAAPSEAVVDATYAPTIAGGASSSPVVVGSVTPEICTVADGVVTFVARGDCDLTADQAGDQNHEPAKTVRQRVAVAGLTQQISVTTPVPTDAVVGGTWTPSATGGGSGLPVGMRSTTPQKCAVADGVVSFVGAGACSLVLSQAGTSRYEPAPEVTLAVTVGKASQRLAFSSEPPDDARVGDTYQPTVVGGSSQAPVLIDTASPGVCTVSGSVVTFTGAGTCDLVATQAGDEDHTAASPVRQSIEVRDACAAVVGIADAPSVLEGDTGTVDLVFPLTLTNAEGCGDLSVSAAITGGTASLGSDVAAPVSPIDLPAGATTGELRVAVLGDQLDERDETVVVTLSDLTGKGHPALGVASATGTITDDDDTVVGDADDPLAACRPGAGVPRGYTLVLGTSGADRLVGSSLDEIFRGGAGADRIRGAGGHDILCGDAGRDILFGGAGDDRMSGGHGADWLRGGAGDDRLLGGRGQDQIAGGPGRDHVVSGSR